MLDIKPLYRISWEELQYYSALIINAAQTCKDNIIIKARQENISVLYSMNFLIKLRDIFYNINLWYIY